MIDTSELKYRKAKKDDAEILFNWANELVVRNASFNPDLIIWEKHIAWFNTKLKDKNVLILIFTVKDIPAGQVRIEIVNEAIIGISIDSAFRGYKLAPTMLKMACHEFWKENELSVYAFIKKDNIASVKSFEKVGFVFDRNDKVDGMECFVYKIEK